MGKGAQFSIEELVTRDRLPRVYPSLGDEKQSTHSIRCLNFNDDGDVSGPRSPHLHRFRELSSSCRADGTFCISSVPLASNLAGPPRTLNIRPLY